MVPLWNVPCSWIGAEGHVGRQAPEDAKGEELDAPGPAGPRREQPGDQGQHEHVAERVGDGDALLQPGQVRIVHVGPDQEDPRQQGEAGGQRQRVDQAAPVPSGVRHLMKISSAGRVQRKGQQVEHVGEGGKGQDHARAALRPGSSTGRRRSSPAPAASSEPRRLAGGPVEHHARHDGDHSAQADQAPGLDAQPGQPVIQPRSGAAHPDRRSRREHTAVNCTAILLRSSYLPVSNGLANGLYPSCGCTSITSVTCMNCHVIALP